MFGLLQNFEQVAGWFSPIFLIGLGIALVLVGLFIWLGGLGLGKILSGAVGAVTGAVCGLFVIRQNIPSAVFLATVLAAFAVIFERIFFIMLAAVLAAAISFTVFARPYLGIPQQLSATNPSPPAIHGSAMNATQTIEVIKVYLLNFNYELKQVRSRIPLHGWVIIAAITLTFFFSGFYSWRLSSALSCATLGVILTFTGMILLLLYKGSAPITGLCRKVPFYGGIFIAMTVFGTVVQLLLCQRAEKRSIRKKRVEDKEEYEKAKQRWRTT
jgi:hypothetical protein